jgi:hypothetical protein
VRRHSGAGIWRASIGRLCLGALASLMLPQGWSAAQAQSIEPRAFSAAPVGVNFLIAGVAGTRGALSFDDAVPLTEAKFTSSGPVLGYVRSLDLWGASGKFDVIVPYAGFSGSALFQGEPVTREVAGFADPLLRLSVILHGAPAMTAEQFRSYKQDWIIGASLQVSLPLGQYDPERLINIGSNRWAVLPRIGISKMAGPWVVELTGTAIFFTANDDFLGGSRLTRQPVFSTQADIIYNFRSGVWASFDATFYTGGRTSLDGIPADNLQSNWRLGTTLVIPVSRRNSVKFYASTGVSARTGNNFDALGFVWQYRWGGGV